MELKILKNMCLQGLSQTMPSVLVLSIKDPSYLDWSIGMRSHLQEREGRVPSQQTWLSWTECVSWGWSAVQPQKKGVCFHALTKTGGALLSRLQACVMWRRGVQVPTPLTRTYISKL